MSLRKGHEWDIILYVSQGRSVENHCANTITAHNIDPGARWPAFDSRVYRLLAI